MKRHRKKLALFLVLVLSSLIAAFAAWAYFTATGSGTSAFTTGSSTISVNVVNGSPSCTYTGTPPYVLCVSPISSGLSPGGVVSVDFNTFVTGGTAGSPVPNYYLGKVSSPTFTVPAGCNASEFHFNSSSAPAATSVNGSATFPAGQVLYQTNKSVTGYLHWDETGVDQGTCAAKVITANWTVGS